MPLQRTITCNSLNPGDSFQITGKVSFSRIMSKIEGEELVQRNERARSRGMITIDKPYTTITIFDAHVVYPNGVNNKRPVDIYAEESLYSSKAHPEMGLCYSTNDKGRNLPLLVQRDPNDSNVIREIPRPDAELAQGVQVTLTLYVFRGKPNNGIGLASITIEDEHVRTRSNSNVMNAYRQFGLTFVPLPESDKHVNPADSNVDGNADDFSSQPVAPAAGQYSPQMTQPQQPAYAGNAQYNSQPYANGPYVEPSSSPFDGYDQPLPPSQQTQGITYRPETGGRNY